ncbi:MAG: S23-interacting protein [Watsoniomyces obsoletus]|nr:MAG: S23-interacting protein [Watsoniomyces obsoletus]
MKTSTILSISVGSVIAGVLAYAVYFDHRRRNDPEFRKSLRREARRQEKAIKEQADAHDARQKDAIKAAMAKAKDQGFPTNDEDKEAFFMGELQRGENMCTDGSDPVDAAMCFYKALKVYPQPRDLISIYDKTVPQPVLDVLAEMIALDKTIAIGPFGPGASSSGSSANVE